LGIERYRVQSSPVAEPVEAKGEGKQRRRGEWVKRRKGEGLPIINYLRYALHDKSLMVKYYEIRSLIGLILVRM
jgi:hypothetical protein